PTATLGRERGAAASVASGRAGGTRPGAASALGRGGAGRGLGVPAGGDEGQRAAEEEAPRRTGRPPGAGESRGRGPWSAPEGTGSPPGRLARPPGTPGTGRPSDSEEAPSGTGCLP